MKRDATKVVGAVIKNHRGELAVVLSDTEVVKISALDSVYYIKEAERHIRETGRATLTRAEAEHFIRKAREE